MNQAPRIRLRDLMPEADGWGHEQGREVFGKLLGQVERHPGASIFGISLEGVRRTDASFPRESVIELAKRYRCHKGFYLVDALNEDLLDNWEAAALKREQPLILWKADGYRVLGPQPSSGTLSVFNFLMEAGSATASAIGKALGLKLTNASTKLKQLLEQGFVLRREEVAPSGGIEYVYRRVR